MKPIKMMDIVNEIFEEYKERFYTEFRKNQKSKSIKSDSSKLKNESDTALKFIIQNAKTMALMKNSIDDDDVLFETSIQISNDMTRSLPSALILDTLKHFQSEILKRSNQIKKKKD